ncbi:hypothetical protein VOLCADRAFT_108798 [Volvox carteri f. nagariensis]|uniref:Tyr recombinase domain-containing protein n=1 Tax=Volvox carteri f. nagariensis TaxID=3068 RepID=D8UMN9_VOLCA|nr:uncharacterized protein VOLCADRAFT_108798 [Volvox carteri f. nagariensis]EFJ39010.1 hypothetical protein VOLCADRAFT_108798 [Volvox carteri f. nagariensis]|eukprot:XP_002959925.1 hypothetical protein VOLCADRAFT_108798 [Volvox carteri f. nagariensis]
MAPALAPVLQFPLGGLPFLRVALLHRLSRDPACLWPERQTMQEAERWFDRVLAQCGLEGLRSIHTLYSLRRGGASAARAAGVPLDIIEAFGGWAAGSSALWEHYLDLGVRGCPRAVAFFGPLAARRVACTLTAERGCLSFGNRLVAGANAGYAKLEPD